MNCTIVNVYCQYIIFYLTQTFAPPKQLEPKLEILLAQFTLFNLAQLANAFLDTVFTQFPRFTFDKFPQPENAFVPIDLHEFETLTVLKLLQFENALFATPVTL